MNALNSALHRSLTMDRGSVFEPAECNANQQIKLPKLIRRQIRSVFRKQTIFLVLVLTSVIIGLGLGIHYNPSVNLSKPHVNASKAVKLKAKQLYYLNFPGLIFIRMMKLLVVPLAICSNISSLSSMRLKSAGVMGCLTVFCFLFGMLIAAINGCLLALAIQPGTYGEPTWVPSSNTTNKLDLDQTLLNLILNLVSDNLFESTFTSAKLQLENVKTGEMNGKPVYEKNFVTHTRKPNGEALGSNIFGLLFFSVLFGIGLQYLGDRAKTVSEFFQGCREVLGWIVSILIWYFPFGVISMVAGTVAGTDDLLEALTKVSMYVVTMIAGLLLQFVILNALFFIVTRKSPFRLMYDTLAAMTCAVGTASSAATMPITLKCLRRTTYANLKVVRFLLPLGTSLNMNGTAVLETVAPIFFLQSKKGFVTVWEACLTVFSGTLATMVTGTIPSGGLITITITMEALDLDLEMASLIYPVDWFLDRLRTPVNVYGNAVATAIVSHFVDLREARELAAAERKNFELHPNAQFGANPPEIIISETNLDTTLSPSLDSGFRDQDEENDEDLEVMKEIITRF